MHIKKVTILGVGLIGGAVGIALRRLGMAGEVTGVFRRQVSLDAAIEVGAVDTGTLDVAEGVAGAEIIILGTGVALFGDLLAAARDSLAPGAVVTDIGSTKRGVVETCEAALAGRDDVHFVGSHPLAGSEKRGPANAPLVRLEGARCAVTRSDSTDAGSLDMVSGLWRALGMEVVVMTPADHDARLAAASHVPHLVAAALTGTVGPDDLAIAASGFRDATRIAAGDPEIWTQIAESNSDEIAPRLRSVAGLLVDMADWMEGGDRAKLVEFLGVAARKRKAMDD